MRRHCCSIGPINLVLIHHAITRTCRSATGCLHIACRRRGCAAARVCRLWEPRARRRTCCRPPQNAGSGPRASTRRRALRSSPARTQNTATSTTRRADVAPQLCHECTVLKRKCSPYSITERRVPELIPVLGSQPAGDVSHKPGGRLPLLSDRPTVTLATFKRTTTNFAAW